MTALTANDTTFARDNTRWGEGTLASLPLAASVVTFIGAQMGYNSAGHIGPLSTVYRFGFAGWAQEDITASAVAGATYLSVIQPPFMSGVARGIISGVSYTAVQMGVTVFASTSNRADNSILGPAAVTDTPLGEIGSYEGGDKTRPIVHCIYRKPMVNGGIVKTTLSGATELIVKGAEVAGTTLRLPTPPLNGIVLLDLDPAANRTVTLPTAALAAAHGIRQIHINNSASTTETITVTDGTYSGAIDQNEAGIFTTDGAVWFGLIGGNAT